MRHRKRRGKLSMRTSQRKATLLNMVRDLIKRQKIETIRARAKEARRIAEHLITIAKAGDVDARRRAYSMLGDRDLVMKLFKEVIPLFKNRTSGYTRIIPLGFRRGDGADMVILELTEKSIVEKLAKKKKAKKEEAVKEEKAEAKGHKHEAEHKETHKEGAVTAPKAVKEVPKAKPTLAEEKRTERAKSEDKKIAGTKNFMKNLRGLFRKRGDR